MCENTECENIENGKKQMEDNVRFLNQIDPIKYRTNFKIEGSSNYAFNLILNEPNHDFVNRLMKVMSDSGIEYRRGSAGGGNQTRQPYIKQMLPEGSYLNYSETEHIHFFGFYIGNFPDLSDSDIDDICHIINSVS